VTWWAPDLGEQVLVVSPSGDLVEAYVLPLGLNHDSVLEPASTPDVHYTRYKDGTEIEYNRETHVLRINCSGTVHVTAQSCTIKSQDNTITGNLSVGGDLLVKGGVTMKKGLAVSGDISSGGSVTDSDGNNGA
jgi:phage baseplate assembly protein V